MSADRDRIEGEVGCLNTRTLPATLVSTAGFNCKVYKTSGVMRRKGSISSVSLVVKCHRFACTRAKLRSYSKDYRRLRRKLGTLIPRAVFVATRIDGQDNAVVLAESREPWFDLANPTHEEEVRPLFERLRRAREQLALFVATARAWERGGRLIDLYGRDNLVLDRNFDVAYLDSFGVFFYPDVVHAVGEVDEESAARMQLSRRRLDYVESLV